MAKGISVHVGVNQAQPSFGVATLQGCVNDANAMFQIATDNGFEATPPFLNTEATLANVEAAILDAANRLDAGDIFLFTFAGHGSVTPTTFSSEELDSQDETILLHDCILIDNYLRRNLWSQFKQDVRILGIADSCHSGTVLTSIPPDDTPADLIPMAVGGGGVAGVSVGKATVSRRDPGLTDPPLVVQRIPAIGKCDRAFSLADRERILEASPDIHKDMINRRKPLGPLNAKLLTLGACKDLELARDGADHGVFTRALLDVWNNGAFVPDPAFGPDADYKNFISQIRKKVLVTSPQQNPILRPLVIDQNFVKQRPFTIVP